MVRSRPAHSLYSLQAYDRVRLPSIVSLSELRAMEQKLKAELADLGKALANTEIDQQFVQAMKPFFDASTADMQNLSGVVAGVQSNFDALLKLFGEPSDTVSTELFGYVSAFLVDFAKAQDENKKRIAEKQRQANKPERKKVRVMRRWLTRQCSRSEEAHYVWDVVCRLVAVLLKELVRLV